MKPWKFPINIFGKYHPEKNRYSAQQGCHLYKHQSTSSQALYRTCACKIHFVQGLCWCLYTGCTALLAACELVYKLTSHKQTVMLRLNKLVSYTQACNKFGTSLIFNLSFEQYLFNFQNCTSWLYTWTVMFKGWNRFFTKRVKNFFSAARDLGPRASPGVLTRSLLVLILGQLFSRSFVKKMNPELSANFPPTRPYMKKISPSSRYNDRYNFTHLAYTFKYTAMYSASKG